MNKLLFVSIALAAARAGADPCMDRAYDVVDRHPTIVTYCAACGDRAPSEPSFAMRGQPIDLAHSYVATSPARYENLAALAGCEVAGVPPSLRVTSETDTGVLITPDRTPIARVAAPLVIATTQLVFVPVDDGPPWPLLAGIFGVTTGVVGVLCALVLRRRRHGAALPRALDLADRLHR